MLARACTVMRVESSSPSQSGTNVDTVGSDSVSGGFAAEAASARAITPAALAVSMLAAIKIAPSMSCNGRNACSRHVANATDIRVPAPSHKLERSFPAAP